MEEDIVTTAIAVSGKGGTGKTTLCGLMVVGLVRRAKTPVLAIDADPNSTLNEVLGVDAAHSIGELREETRENIDAIPTGMPKETFLEYQIQDALVEAKGFDLLVMGRPEGPGCYCYINSVLRKYMDALGGNYPYVVMDNEAGMEHLARQTTQSADHLLITSDASIRGIDTAARIAAMAGNEKLKIGDVHLVLSRVTSAPHAAILERIKAHGLDLIGTVPNDAAIERSDLEGKSFWELPDDSPALVAAEEILERIVG